MYHAYQELLLSKWLATGKRFPRPRFRVVFLTQSVERAYHILSLVPETTRYRGRRLVYAATLDAFLTDADRLFSPLFLDHLGGWQALVDLHPTAPYQRAPVRLVRPVVGAENPSPLMRAAAAADFGNGVSAAVEWGRFLFINTDLTIYLHRDPVGEWVCLDASTQVEPTGVGLAESELYDGEGRVGRSLQALLVDALAG